MTSLLVVECKFSNHLHCNIYQFILLQKGLFSNQLDNSFTCIHMHVSVGASVNLCSFVQKFTPRMTNLNHKNASKLMYSVFFNVFACNKGHTYLYPANIKTRLKVTQMYSFFYITKKALHAAVNKFVISILNIIAAIFHC